MTHIEQFIKDAIEGGCDLKDRTSVEEHYTLHGENMVSFEAVLLDPLAWQAVGKTRGWRNIEEGTFEAEFTCWQAYFEGFFRSIRDGKSIEDALAAISN